MTNICTTIPPHRIYIHRRVLYNVYMYVRNHQSESLIFSIIVFTKKTFSAEAVGPKGNCFTVGKCKKIVLSWEPNERVGSLVYRFYNVKLSKLITILRTSRRFLRICTPLILVFYKHQNIVSSIYTYVAFCDVNTPFSSFVRHFASSSENVKWRPELRPTCHVPLKIHVSNAQLREETRCNHG